MCARSAHLLSTGHPRTGNDRDRLEEAVRGAKTASVSNRHREHAGHCPCERHLTTVRRTHWRADFSGVVHSPMTRVPAGRREFGDNRAIYRRTETDAGLRKTQCECENKQNHTVERTESSRSVLEVRQDRVSHRCGLGRRFHKLGSDTAQIVRPERLREECIGTATIGTLPGLFLCMSREHENRELLSSWIGT